MKIKKLIDCSQTFFHNNPGYLPYELCEINYETLIAKDGYQSERMYMNTHTSTHFDAPRHHFIDGMDAAEYPIENLVGEAVPMDFFDLPVHTGIGPELLDKYADKVKPGDIVLLCTGLGLKRDWGVDYVDNWTFLTPEGAQWMVDHGVKGVCIDGLSVGGPRPEDGGGPTHKIALRNNIWYGEEVYLPKELLTEKRWNFAFLPLKIEGASGAPGRAIAWIEE